VSELILFYSDAFEHLFVFQTETKVSFASEGHDCRAIPLLFEKHGCASIILELVSAALTHFTLHLLSD